MPRAVVVIVLIFIGEVADTADAIRGELCRTHRLIDLRADIGRHAETFHRVRIEAVLDLRPRETEAVDVVGLALVVEVERHAIVCERRLIEHAANAELARENVVELLHQLQTAEANWLTAPTRSRIDVGVIRPLNEIHRGGVGIAL